MKNTLNIALSGWLLVGILALLLATVAGVQAAELKIGFVNAAQVLDESPQAAAARSSLEKEFSPRDKALIESRKTLSDLEERLMRDGAIMSESERGKLERDILARKRDLKRKQEEFREDLNIRRNESFDKLRRRVFEVIVDIAKQDNYDLIVSDGVVYAAERVDITDKVIERLKQESKSVPKQ
jgi:outer membrane protein